MCEGSSGGTDYINASFINVSICNKTMRYVGMFGFLTYCQVGNSLC